MRCSRPALQPTIAQLLAALTILVITADATAQRADRYDDWWSDPRGELAFYGQLGVPVGEFQSHVNLGGGGGMSAALFLGGERLAALRVDGNFVIYGSDAYDTRLSATVPVDVRVRTTNSILSMGVGPQVYLTRGPLRPYVYGTLGFAYFVTETSVRGHGDAEPFASSVNLGDFNLALSGGGGLSVEVHDGRNPLALDISASYQHNGLAEYLIDGDTGRGGGWGHWGRGDRRRGPGADPIVSDANLVQYRVGVRVGVG